VICKFAEYAVNEKEKAVHGSTGWKCVRNQVRFPSHGSIGEAWIEEVYLKKLSHNFASRPREVKVMA